MYVRTYVGVSKRPVKGWKDRGQNVAFRRKVVFVVEAGRNSTKIAGMKLERPLGGKAKVFMQSVCRC